MIRTARRTAILATAALLLAGPALARETLVGSGKMATEARPVSGFTHVGIVVPGKVQLTQGNTESLTITADDNVLPHIESVVEKGVLKVRFRHDHDLSVRNVTITLVVNARELDGISIGGSGDVTASAIKSPKLALNIGGSGNVKVASVDAAEVAVRIGGSGDVSIGGGRTEKLSVSIGGSGEMKAPRLESKHAKVTVAGSGDASVWVRESLAVTVAGSGGVRYYGDPKVERTVVGSGDVRRAGASPT